MRYEVGKGLALPLFIRATACLDDGDPDRAIVDCNLAISADPELALAWCTRGGAKLDKDNYQGAIDDCTEAIRLDPTCSAAWLNRAGAHYNRAAARRLGDPEPTGDDFEASVKDAKESLRLYP